MNRFLRTEKLLGSESFKRLTTRYVVVVGLGAVGGYVVEGLARSGVGRLRLVDFDVISRTNINRQILALESTLNRPSKPSSIRDRIWSLMPLIPSIPKCNFSECLTKWVYLYSHPWEQPCAQIRAGSPLQTLLKPMAALWPDGCVNDSENMGLNRGSVAFFHQSRLNSTMLAR